MPDERTYTLRAPNGSRIIGTNDLIPGCALASRWERNETGELVPIYDGETDVFWDGQETIIKDDDIEVCAQDGSVWPLSLCTTTDEEDEDEEDEG